MRRSLLNVWDRLRERQPVQRGKSSHSSFVRPQLELLEDRVTPTGATIAATGVLAGHVFSGGGVHGLAGVDVTLSGTSTTGRTVNLSTTTDAGGAYAFTQVLPGSYNLQRDLPSGFVGPSPSGISSIALGEGQVNADLNLAVGGLSPEKVSLAFFLNLTPTGRFSAPAGAAGTGTALVFSLDSANPLAAQSLALGATSFIDLAGRFSDPDTTNNTVVTFNTSQGSFNVQLFSKDAPQTATNFLNYLAAGDYSSNLFHRLSNLNQTTVMNPPLTPVQVLQGGGFTVNADMSDNVTGFSNLATFQPIQNEFSAAHPNAVGTLAMARGTNPNSATSQFFFNLTDNSQTLGASNGGGFAVFGQVTDTTGATALQNFATQYTPSAQTTANPAFVTLPLRNGFTPANNFPTGATKADLAIINSITLSQPPTGQLTYTIVGNTNPGVVTATLGSNTATSTFSANQLRLVAGNTAGTSIITVQITDNRGETVTKQFTVTVGQ